MSLASVVVLLQTALSLLMLVNSNPSLPQSMRDNAQQMAQQAIAQATGALASNHAANTTSGSTRTVVLPSGGTAQIDAQGNIISTSAASSAPLPTAVSNTDDKTIGTNYYIANKTCVGLSNQNQYSYCIQYAFNPPPTTAMPASQTASVTNSVTDYSQYTPVTLALYAANPPAYFGKPISVTGMLNAFMPKGRSGGSTNYLELINPFDQSQPKLMAEVDSATAYADAVSSLQDKSSPIYQFVRVYGIGVEGEPMTVNSLFGSGTLTMPVINATRIDKCVHGRMNQTVLTGSTFDDNFACTDWETIAPASAVAASAAI